MTRRRLFALPAALALGRPALAQDFPGIAYRNYSRCLPDFLRELAARAYQRRNREIAALTSPEAIRKRQAWVRDTFWKLVGGMPERTPLNARVLGSFERPGYRVEKVLYESRPNFHIPANLYIPTAGRPPYPGILFQMGHSLNGKAAATYQSCCQGLARLGYLVLAFDPMGQGERTYYPDAGLRRTRLSSADEEHTLPGKQMLLLGDTSSRMQVWDAVRSLDYLAAHPLADPQRLASTGQSGGGTLTMLLAAVDDRLAAAAVSSGNTENFACAAFNPPGSTDDAEQNFLDSGPAGFDRWDLLYPMAPRPLLISVSDKDFFGTYSSEYIASGWEEYRKLRRVYETLGHPDRLAWVDTPLPHGLSYDSRLQIYTWFGRWLKGESKPVSEEPPVQLEPDEALWVAPSGNVVRSFGGETPFTLNRKRNPVRQPAPLDRLLRVDRSEPRLAALRRVPSRGLDIEAAEIPSAPGVWLPAWLYLPRTKPSRILIALEPAGRNVRWHEGELYQELALRGIAACVPDVRGVGDLAPEFSRAHPRYARSHNDDEDYAWASLILGKPLLGQRVTDILAVAAALRTYSALQGLPVHVAAAGRLSVAALMAAALDPRMEAVYLAGCLASYRGIVDTQQYRASFADFVPGLLLHTDLPDIAASLAPRRLRLAGTVDAAGARLQEAEVRRLYPSADVQREPLWDTETLAAV